MAQSPEVTEQDKAASLQFWLTHGTPLLRTLLDAKASTVLHHHQTRLRSSPDRSSDTFIPPSGVPPRKQDILREPSERSESRGFTAWTITPPRLLGASRLVPYSELPLNLPHLASQSILGNE
jgi:hypothetical protein